MSHAGVRSSRGDGYQVCVAMYWAIRMVKDSNLAWIELDSTRVIAGGIPAPVDDVIVGLTDGKETCCQCKKNQPGFAVWRVDDLEDDLKKAANHLVADTNAQVRFYSRGDFGDMARLADRALQMPDLAAFMHELPKNLQPELAKLTAAWADALAKGTHNAHDLLKRITFKLTLDVDSYKEELQVDLSQIVTRANDAFNTLWTTLDNLGARTTSNQLIADSHRITRDEVLQLLYDKGCAVAPPRAQAEVEGKLATMSRIGREWRREIAGRSVEREAVAELLSAVKTHARILLTDGPGAGKTCVLLNLVEALEALQGVTTLFLQAREFAEVTAHEGRVALGLDPDIPALVSAMSLWKRVVVIIDSLDVLSLNRETESLTFFLSLIDRLASIPNVCVIAACRSFDLQYNKKLSCRTWDLRIETGLLDWDSVVEPLLSDLGVDTQGADATTRALLGNPRNLALYTDAAAKSSRKNVSSAQELTEAYLDAVVAGEPELGNKAMVAIETMAQEMLSKRRNQLPRSRIEVEDDMLRLLCSANVLFQSARHEVGYGHQTLLDALAVRAAIRRGQSLLDFIQSLQPVPFIRPAIRAYFTHLRMGNRKTFRAQVREVFEADVAFHIKRLIAESYAVHEPQDDDWSLMRHLFRHHQAHFRSIYDVGQQVSWYHFWMRHFVPMLQSEGNATWLAIHFNKLWDWFNDDPVGVIDYWTSFATSSHATDLKLRGQLGLAQRHFKQLAQVDAQPFLEALVALPFSGHDLLGNVLIKWAQHDPRGDALIWRYVSADVPVAPKSGREIANALHCDEGCFSTFDEFVERLAVSDVLLNLTVSSIESWAASLCKGQEFFPDAGDRCPNNELLRATTYEITHSNHQLRHKSPLDRLVLAVETAVLRRAQAHDDWWKGNARRICLNDCGGLRYIGILAMTQFPEVNVDITKEFFADDRRPELTDTYELGNLIAATALFLGDTLSLVEQHILQRRRDRLPDFQHLVDKERYSLLCRIPGMLRSDPVKSSLARMVKELALPNQQPDIYSSGGFVIPPFDGEELTALSDEALVQLLTHSQSLGDDLQGIRDLTGGADSVDRLLCSVAAEHPGRFLELLTEQWGNLPDSSKLSIFGGAADYLQRRYGQVTANHWHPKEEVNSKELIHLLLTELERHPLFWTGTREGATAVSGCASIVTEVADVERVVFLAHSHASAEDPRCDERQDDDLISTAISSSRGELADGLVSLLENLLHANSELPDTLPSVLMRLARDCHPAVRAAVIGKLAFVQTKSSLGWQLFDAAFSDDDQRVWTYAADTLYYATGKLFANAEPYIDRMESSPVASVRKAWGRLSALAMLGTQISRELLLEKLVAGANESAWEGAISVWVANVNSPEFEFECIASLQHAATHSIAQRPLREHLQELFTAKLPFVRVPLFIFRSVYSDGSVDELMVGNLPSRMVEWLCLFVEIDPDEALEYAEIIAAFCKRKNTLLFYDSTHLGTLLTSLFREAEEREPSDVGAMLRRVVTLQDILLSIPTSSMREWLHAAERPDD